MLLRRVSGWTVGLLAKTESLSLRGYRWVYLERNQSFCRDMYLGI